MTRRLTALGAYIFAGGFTLGMREHFDVVGHLEDGLFGVATSQHNLGVEVHHDRLAWPVQRYAGVDVVYGNPPCAPWAAAANVPRQRDRLAGHGVTHRWEIDARVDCVRHQFALLGQLRPHVWAWESVARAYSIGRPFIDTLVMQAHELGYVVTLLRVDGAWCGLPQRRRRFFFVAHDVELPFEHPNQVPPTVGDVLRPELYGPPHYIGEDHPITKAKMTGTVSEFVHGMRPGQGGIARFYEWAKAINRPVELTPTGKMKGRPNFLMGRLANDQVCGTIVSGTCLIHPDHDRFLTVKETQLLSSYPVSYEFIGRDAYGQISRAVLPKVGAWLGGVLKAGLEAAVPADHGWPLREISYLKPLTT